jgi:hypothetical protein
MKAGEAAPSVEAPRNRPKENGMTRLLNDRRRVLAALIAVAAAATIGTSAFAASAPAKTSTYASQLAAARLATTKYATNLARAKADGYGIITQMIPSMGWHFMNPKVTGFDLKKPAILVYLRHGKQWQLGALEWVFPKKPAHPPVPGARYGIFPAACHYVDGTFTPANAEAQCAQTSPQSGAKFNFWHGPLITLHVWLWYPNPSGIYSGTNPLAMAYDHS